MLNAYKAIFYLLKISSVLWNNGRSCNVKVVFKLNINFIIIGILYIILEHIVDLNVNKMIKFKYLINN